VIRQVADARCRHLWTLTADIKVAFYLVQIPAEARKRFVFTYDSTQYAFTRLPMGCTFSAEYMNIIATTMTHNISFAARAVHIDNIRLLGTKAQMRNAVAVLEERALKYGVLFNEPYPSMVTQHGDFLKLRYDYVARTRRLAPEALVKLQSAQQQLAVTHRPATRRTWISSAVRIAHYARAMAITCHRTPNCG
jgi:hypothetical protein